MRKSSLGAIGFGLALSASVLSSACGPAPRPEVTKTPTGISARCNSIDACRTPEAVDDLQKACKEAALDACGDIGVDLTGPMPKQAQEQCELKVSQLLANGGGKTTVQCPGTYGPANRQDMEIKVGE